MTNNNVTSFYAYNQNIQIFPFGLEKMFKNLFEFTIRNGSLRRITQQNLFPFHNLTYLCLERNLIEVIPARLFQFNNNLKSIDLSHNPIFTINSHVFDHLSKLTTLRLKNNLCIDESVHDSRLKVRRLIRSVNIKCLCKHMIQRTCKMHFKEIWKTLTRHPKWSLQSQRRSRVRNW